MTHTRLSVAIGLGVLSLLWAGARFLSKIIVDRTTCLPDLPQLGRPTKTKYKGRAIVCGGSYGGLMAARMLADHFDQVVVIESEPTFGDGTRNGTNIMQHNQLHAFAAIVLSTWRQLWDDTDDQIRLADGRITVADNNYYLGNRAHVPADYPHEWIALCRPTAEAMLRRMTRRHPRIQFVNGFATGLLAGEPGSDTVGGVAYRPHDNPTGNEIELESNLVIDATGMACRGAKWIGKLGYPPPRRDYYDPHGAYTTAVVKVTPDVIAKIPWPEPYERVGTRMRISPIQRMLTLSTDQIGWIVCAPCEAGYSRRGTYLSRWDGDRISFLLSVFNDFEPTPQTKAEVYEWARSCKMEPWNYDLLDVLEGEVKDMEIYRCRLGQFYHYRYDLLERLPSNFVPIADAIMKLNPVYGQGGSKACSDVCTLDGVLRRGRRGEKFYQDLPQDLCKTFLEKQTPRANVLMNFNKALDYAWGETELFPGEKVTDRSFLRTWWNQVAVATMYSTKVSGIVQEILHGLAPPTNLFSPVVVWTVLLVKLGRVRPAVT